MEEGGGQLARHLRAPAGGHQGHAERPLREVAREGAGHLVAERMTDEVHRCIHLARVEHGNDVAREVVQRGLLPLPPAPAAADPARFHGERPVARLVQGGRQLVEVARWTGPAREQHHGGAVTGFVVDDPEPVRGRLPRRAEGGTGTPPRDREPDERGECRSYDPQHQDGGEDPARDGR
jgi:hypothetical protein